MSESAIPFAAWDDEEPKPSRKRTLVALGAATTVAAVAAGFLLLQGGGGVASSGVVPQVVRPPVGAPIAPSASPTPVPTLADIAAADGRNPFISQLPNAKVNQVSSSAPVAPVPPPAAPLVPAPAPVVPAPAPVVPAPAPVVPAPAPVVPAPAPVVPAPAPLVPSPAPVAPVVGTTASAVATPTQPAMLFAVLSVASNNTSALVSVGGATATVHPGDTFGGRYTVVALTAGNCGEFTDGITTWRLCEKAAALR